MDETTYKYAVQNTNILGWPSHNWNYRYRLALEANSLMLTSKMPDDISFFLQAPWPTAQESGQPHTPETDKYAWNIPSWIVPIHCKE